MATGAAQGIVAFFVLVCQGRAIAFFRRLGVLILMICRHSLVGMVWTDSKTTCETCRLARGSR